MQTAPRARKPYAAVFFVLACLEYAAALQLRAVSGLELTDAAEPYLAEAVTYYEKLRTWIGAPHTLGRPPQPTPDGGVSVLADVMCLASLSEELSRRIPEQHERWLADIRDAQRRVAVHYDKERCVLMESAQ